MTLEEAMGTGRRLRRSGRHIYRLNNSNIAAHLWVKNLTLDESAWLDPAFILEFIWLDISDLQASDWEVNSQIAE